MSKRKSFWETLLEIQKIVPKDIWDKVPDNLDTVFEVDLNLELRKKFNEKLKEVKEKLENCIIIEQPEIGEKEEEIMAAKKPATKKPKTDKYANAPKGPKPANKPKKKKGK